MWMFVLYTVSRGHYNLQNPWWARCFISVAMGNAFTCSSSIGSRLALGIARIGILRNLLNARPLLSSNEAGVMQHKVKQVE